MSSAQTSVNSAPSLYENHSVYQGSRVYCYPALVKGDVRGFLGH